jgi:hypothetical protein
LENESLDVIVVWSEPLRAWRSQIPKQHDDEIVKITVRIGAHHTAEILLQTGVKAVERRMVGLRVENADRVSLLNNESAKHRE